MRLSGNTILITGGGAGIGHALAEEFHQRGNDDVSRPLDEVVLTSTIATNLLGPLRLNSALIDHLGQQPMATIINVSSMTGYAPLATSGIYSMTKAALHSYTMSLRYRLRGSSVTVAEVAPPYVQTGLQERNTTDPRAMPLSQFISETMDVLATDEVQAFVERAKTRADAQRPDEVAGMEKFNDMFRGV